MAIVPIIQLFGIDVVRFSIDLLTLYSLFLVVSLTLNLEAGYAGIPNFGKVMFVAAGAAAAGSASGQLAAFVLMINTHGNYTGYIYQVIPQIDAALTHNPGLSIGILLFGMLVAAVVGAVLGFAASFPAIRLREDYLGMLLLAAAQFFQIILSGYEPIIGGTQGIEVPNVFGWFFGDEIGVRDVVVLLVLGAFALLVFVYCEKVVRSPLGRTLRAIRDSELASRSLGKNDVAIRRKVIVVASAISGMAGALLTFYLGSVGAETWTRVTWTFWIWVILILGGAANNAGVALGAFSFTLLLKAVDQVKFNFQPFIPVDVNWLEYIMFAALLIGILVVRPDGILPEKPTLTLPRSVLGHIMESNVNPVDDEKSQPAKQTI